LLEDGSREVSCKKIEPLQALYDVTKAARYLARLAELF
jgi:hypothetical protein